jgi:hypothetical protein
MLNSGSNGQMLQQSPAQSIELDAPQSVDTSDITILSFHIGQNYCPPLFYSRAQQ